MYERVAMPRTFSLAVLAPVVVLAAALPAPARAQAQMEPGGVATGLPPGSPGLRLETTHIAGRTYLASMSDGGRAELTLDPRLQESTEEVLRSFQIPYGAAVAISIPDGRVLALVGH